MVDTANSSGAVGALNASTPPPGLPQKPYDGYDGENIVSAVFSSILASVIIVGNGLVMLAFKVNYKLRTVTNMCFVSLALCDFLVGLISIPLWTYYTFNAFNPMTSNMHVYLFYISFDIFNGAASIFQLTAISLERCFSIVAPVRHRSMPVYFYYVMVIVVWLLAAFSSLLRLLPYNQVTKAEWYNVYALLVCFVLPVLIMITSYALLFRTARKRSRLPVRSSKNLQGSWSSQLKTIVTLLIVTGLFVVAWSPFFIFIALARYLPGALPTSVEGLTHLWRFVKWMHYSNSSLNPFVYAYRNREFNYSFKMILKACVKCQSCDEVNRQLKRPNHLGLRRHTREGTSFSQMQLQCNQISRRESLPDGHSMSSRKAAESIRLNDAVINEKEIQLSIIVEK